MTGNRGNIAVIILAAGLGTRMKSDKAKVLHEVLGKPMIMYVTETAAEIAGGNVIVVVGNQSAIVKETVSKYFNVFFSIQEEQLGTGHAVRCAFPNLTENIEQVVILNGDVPLIRSDTVHCFLENHVNADRDVSVLAVDVEDPKGYGRILLDKNRRVIGIVEEADATEEQKQIRTVNTGIYCVKKNFLFSSVKKIRQNNTQSEFYLTDIIRIGNSEHKEVGVFIGRDADEFIGVNNPQELVSAEKIMKSRLGNIT